jgi:hypothetical protein
MSIVFWVVLWLVKQRGVAGTRQFFEGMYNFQLCKHQHTIDKNFDVRSRFPSEGGLILD